MPSATIQISVSGDISGLYSKSHSVTGGASHRVQEPIPDSSTDLQVAFALDVSQAKSFMLLADQDMLVETNSGTEAGNTFTLAAGVPYVWPSTNGAAFVDTEADAVTTDITALFVTNTSGTAGTLTLDAILDPTA
jgi:hypothetical protein